MGASWRNKLGAWRVPSEAEQAEEEYAFWGKVRLHFGLDRQEDEATRKQRQAEQRQRQLQENAWLDAYRPDEPVPAIWPARLPPARRVSFISWLGMALLNVTLIAAFLYALYLALTWLMSIGAAYF